MKALVPYVNIIPVIAKSDSMTNEESGLFKRQLRDVLDKNKIPIFFDNEAPEQIFNVIGSRSLIGDHVRFKQYLGVSD